MIDLTKPIRSKFVKNVYPMYVKIIRGEIRLEWKGEENRWLDYSVTQGDLERNYENIPEPRKPQEWYLDLFSTKFYASKEFIQPNARRRVIDWPEGAPLPDWPEGYT